MKTMKKTKLIIIVFCVIIISFFMLSRHSSSSIVIKEEFYHNYDKYINIDEYDEEDIEIYMEEVSSLTIEEEEKLIIVTTLEEINDAYGATKIIPGPNNQYFIIYETLEDMLYAYEEFEKTEALVDMNDIQYIDEEINTVEASYNSWGIEATGLDVALKEANSKKLNDITVAIIDTGLDVDLFVENYPNKNLTTYSYVDSSTNIMADTNSHGTHIAGTIAEGTGDNVSMLVIRAGVDTFSTTTLISAVNYITTGKRASVVNISIGGTTYNSSYHVALAAAASEGIIITCSAGNTGEFEYRYPATLEETLATVNLTSELVKYSGSTYSDAVSFSAPGRSILSINGTKTGTSMAAPHLANAIAIFKSYNPDYTFEEINEIAKYYAIDLGEPGYDEYYGNGMVYLANIEYCEESYCSGPIKYYSDTLWEYELIDSTNIRLTGYNGDLPESVEIPSTIDGYTVKALGAGVLGYSCSTTGSGYYKGPTTLSLPSTLTEIDSCAFKGNKTIKTITSSASSVSIGSYSFSDATSLVSLNLNINYIGSYAFSGCTKLSTYNYASTLKTIGSYAFYNTTIGSLAIPDSVTSIGSYAYANANITSISIGSGLSSLGTSAFSGNAKLNSIAVSTSNNTYDSRDASNSIIGTINGKVTLITASNSTIIPESVTDIYTDAFSYRTIDTLYIPSGTTLETKDIQNSTINELYIAKNSTISGLSDLNSDAYNNSVSLYKLYNAALNSISLSSSSKYVTIDPVSYDLALSRTIYTAGESVSKSDVTLSLTYGTNVSSLSGSETINSSYITISYPDNKSYLAVGDNKIYLTVINEYDDWVIDIEKAVSVYEVQEIVPNIVVANKSYDGTTSLSTSLISINNLSKSNYTITSAKLNSSSIGSTTADITVKLTDSYFLYNKFVGGLQEKTFTVDVEITDAVIIDSTKNYEVYYDGASHSVTINLNISGYDILYSINNQSYDLSENPEFIEPGEYTLYYKVQKDNYSDYYGSATIKIYGVNATEDIEIIDNYLFVNNLDTSIENISNNLSSYGTFTYKVLNSDSVEIQSDYIATSYKYNIVLNNSKTYNYSVIIRGDVHADAAITALDYVLIKNHIMESSVLTGDYLLAADANADGVVSSLDYVVIKNYIMNGGN